MRLSKEIIDFFEKTFCKEINDESILYEYFGEFIGLITPEHFYIIKNYSFLDYKDNIIAGYTGFEQFEDLLFLNKSINLKSLVKEEYIISYTNKYNKIITLNSKTNTVNFYNYNLSFDKESSFDFNQLLLDMYIK